MKNFVRALLISAHVGYRLTVLALLLNIASEIAHTNHLTLAIGQMLYRVIGGPTS